MPDAEIPVVEPGDSSEPDNQGDEIVAEIVTNEFPKLMESGNLQIAAGVLGQGAAAAGARRIDGADQLSRDAQSMWVNAFANPTNLMAKALQGMYESGSGRTRAETNSPANTAAPNITIEKQS